MAFFNNFLIRYGKVHSSILGHNGEKDTGYSFSDFWNDLGVFPYVFLAVLILCSIVFYPLIRDRVQKKRDATAVLIPGKDRKVSPSRIRKVVLYGRETVLLEKGDLFTVPIPEKEGYSFGGWFYDSACTEPYKTTKITENITLYPKWVRHD